MKVDEMLRNEIIRESKSRWSFPVVRVPKKDGSRRFCVDCGLLNARTLQDPYPLPRIDDILDRLRDSSLFSTVDLKSGYWQIAVEETSIEKTTF